MVTFDTSALLALFDNRERHHAQVMALAESERGPLILPVGILSEACYFVERWMGFRAMKLFFEDIRDGIYLLHCGDADIERILDLTDRYQELPLGYADAAGLLVPNVMGAGLQRSITGTSVWSHARERSRLCRRSHVVQESL